jgi:hypothetical protein
MRSAWSATRSTSLETVFPVCPSCLLALPTVFAIDLTSISGRLIERGTGTPSTRRWRVRERIRRPPATPAAVAPAAIAGPLALLATSLTVPTNPFELLLRLWVLRLRLWVLRLRLWVLRPRLWLLRLAVEPLDFREPLLEREEPLRDVLAFAPEELARAPLLEADPFDEPLLPLARELLDDLLLPCLLPDDLLEAATAHLSLSRTLLVKPVPTNSAANRHEAHGSHRSGDRSP